MTLSVKQIDTLVANVRGTPFTRSSEKASAVTKLSKAVATALDLSDARPVVYRMIEAETVEAGEAVFRDALRAAANEEEVAVEATAQVVAELPAAEAAEIEAAAPRKSGRGRASGFAGKRLYAVDGAKPRREGSHGARSLAIVAANPGIAYEDFVARGGRRVDIAWDVAHGKARAE